MLFKRLLLCLTQAFGLFGQALADAVFVGQDVQVTVYHKPCTGRVADIVAALKVPKELVFQKAKVVYQGQTLEACWVTTQGQVLIIDETGDGGAIPEQLFQRLKEV